MKSIGESYVDSRCRLSLGRYGVAPDTRFRIERQYDGTIILTPVRSVLVTDLPDSNA